MRGWCVLWVLVCAVLAFPVQGNDELDLQFHKQDGRYHFAMDAWFSADPEQVWAVLTDYAALSDYSPSIQSAHLMRREGNEVEVLTVLSGCVLMFCRSIRRLEQVTEIAFQEIIAVVVPEHSDLLYGVTRWQLEPEGEGTRLQVESVVQPDFWVPPVLGARMMRRDFNEIARGLFAELR